MDEGRRKQASMSLWVWRHSADEYNRAPSTLLPHVNAYDSFLEEAERHQDRVELRTSMVAYLDAELTQLYRDIAWIESQGLPVEVIVGEQKEPISEQAHFASYDSVRRQSYRYSPTK